MSLPRYPKYKDSGVEWLGEVPTHWKVKRLRFVCQLNPSKSEIVDIDKDTLVSFLPMEAIGDDGSLDIERERPISELETGYTFFRNGDVAVAKITPCFENGKGALMQNLRNGFGFGTTELIVARPKPTETSGKYLHWIFVSSPFMNLGEAHMYGAGGQKRVPDDFVRNFTVAFPPPEEQSTNAAFLDHETAKIDALVQEQRRLIELLKENRQAVISHAVTKGLNPAAPMKDSGVVWLGKVPEHWEVMPLRRCLLEHRQGYYSEGAYVDGGVKLLRITDLLDFGKVDFTQCPQVEKRPELEPFLLRKSDFVFARTGGAGTFGLVETIVEPVAYASYLIRFRFFRKTNPNFLRYFFLASGFQEAVKQNIHGGVNQNIHAEDIKNQYVAVPPQPQQAVIAAFLDCETAKCDTLTTAAAQAVDLLQERRAALISATVTGKIDVRGLVKEDAA